MRVLVKDVMSRGVLKLNKTQTINEVKQLFLDRVIDGAPVVDDSGRVIGVFTKTHLLRAMGKSLDIPIERLMNRNVLTISETMPIEEAMNIPVGRLPVVNKDGKMVGWLTRTDLARAFMENYKASIEGLYDIIDSTAHGIIAINGEGNISLFNKTAQKLWKVDVDKIMGLPVKEVFPVMNMDNVLITGKALNYKLQVDGLMFTIELSPIKVSGEITGAVAEFYQTDND